jgi:hypothetical protein
LAHRTKSDAMDAQAKNSAEKLEPRNVWNAPEKREIWKDRHVHLVRRQDGRFVTTRQYHKPIEFEGIPHYKYMVKYWVEGRKKPKFMAVPSEMKLYAPPGSRQRKAIYAYAKKKLEKSDVKVERMRLKTTIDSWHSKRVEWRG